MPCNVHQTFYKIPIDTAERSSIVHVERVHMYRYQERHGILLSLLPSNYLDRPLPLHRSSSWDLHLFEELPSLLIKHILRLAPEWAAVKVRIKRLESRMFE